MWRRGKQTRPGRMYPDPIGDAREEANLDAIEALASPIGSGYIRPGRVCLPRRHMSAYVRLAANPM